MDRRMGRGDWSSEAEMVRGTAEVGKLRNYSFLYDSFSRNMTEN